MSYATISNWDISTTRGSDTAKNNENIINEKYLPAFKALGATHAHFIYTGDKTASIVAIYRDEATATSAVAKQNALRSQGSAEMSNQLIGDSRGDVFASF